MKWRAIAVTGCLALGWTLGWTSMTLAQGEPTLSLEIEPQEARVGDVVEATLTLRVPQAPAQEPEFPNWQRHWGSAEIRDIERVVGSRDGDGGARYVQRLRLTSFRPGVVELPPATVVLPGTQGAEPVSVSTAGTTGFEVVSVLPPVGEEEIEPKPPESPRALPVGESFWWTAGIFAALAAGLLALLLARRTPEETYAGEAVDPWTALEQALARLAKATDPETVFTGLSLELRRYLGRSLELPAVESTTTELRRRLLRSGLPSSVCGEVIRLLREADSVKFARQSPARDRLARSLDEVHRAAGEVRAFLQPAQPADGEERAA